MIWRPKILSSLVSINMRKRGYAKTTFFPRWDLNLYSDTLELLEPGPCLHTIYRRAKTPLIHINICKLHRYFAEHILTSYKKSIYQIRNLVPYHKMTGAINLLNCALPPAKPETERDFARLRLLIVFALFYHKFQNYN